MCRLLSRVTMRMVPTVRKFIKTRATEKTAARVRPRSTRLRTVARLKRAARVRIAAKLKKVARDIRKSTRIMLGTKVLATDRLQL
jgi:hypothetical protein